MAYKNNGAIPAPHTLLDIDHDLLRTSGEAFDTVGALLNRNRFKLAITEAMRVVGAANKYISDTEPWKLGGDPERRDTVLHTALQVVSDANTLLTPFLPHAAQKIHEALGGSGVWAAQPEIHEVSEEDGADYPVIMGNYAGEQARWESRPITSGTPLQRPTPLFTKIEESLGKTGPEWAPIER
jgi:methionyl-tRNA synthetase